MFLCIPKTIDMNDAFEPTITLGETSKLHDIKLENLPFGKYFSDHMLEADYEDGVWKNVEIRPYQPVSFFPALSAIHYGQSIFEGIKAFSMADGGISIFRPYENLKRFNHSAERMEMPAVPEELFIEGMRRLIRVDKGWVPSFPDHSLYIRPFMFATDQFLGVRPSETYKFMIILCPSGPFFMEPQRIYVEEHFVRAVAGGVGFAKAAGNYGAAMHATAQARKKGFDQVLWTDPYEHKYVQEIGMMNVFFRIGEKVITPDLDAGTILGGVTRNSVIVLLRESGVMVEERQVSMDEITDAYDNGQLREVFGSGTAASVSFIRELSYKGKSMSFDPDAFETALALRTAMTDIKEGRVPDNHGWMLPV